MSSQKQYNEITQRLMKPTKPADIWKLDLSKELCTYQECVVQCNFGGNTSDAANNDKPIGSFVEAGLVIANTSHVYALRVDDAHETALRCNESLCSKLLNISKKKDTTRNKGNSRIEQANNVSAEVDSSTLLQNINMKKKPKQRKNKAKNTFDFWNIELKIVPDKRKRNINPNNVIYPPSIPAFLLEKQTPAVRGAANERLIDNLNQELNFKFDYWIHTNIVNESIDEEDPEVNEVENQEQLDMNSNSNSKDSIGSFVDSGFEEGSIESSSNFCTDIIASQSDSCGPATPLPKSISLQSQKPSNHDIIPLSETSQPSGNLESFDLSSSFSNCENPLKTSNHVRDCFVKLCRLSNAELKSINCRTNINPQNENNLIPSTALNCIRDCKIVICRMTSAELLSLQGKNHSQIESNEKQTDRRNCSSPYRNLKNCHVALRRMVDTELLFFAHRKSLNSPIQNKRLTAKNKTNLQNFKSMISKIMETEVQFLASKKNSITVQCEKIQKYDFIARTYSNNNTAITSTNDAAPEFSGMSTKCSKRRSVSKLPVELTKAKANHRTKWSKPVKRRSKRNIAKIPTKRAYVVSCFLEGQDKTNFYNSSNIAHTPSNEENNENIVDSTLDESMEDNFNPGNVEIHSSPLISAGVVSSNSALQNTNTRLLTFNCQEEEEEEDDFETELANLNNTNPCTLNPMPENARPSQIIRSYYNLTDQYKIDCIEIETEVQQWRELMKSKLPRSGNHSDFVLKNYKDIVLKSFQDLKTDKLAFANLLTKEKYEESGRYLLAVSQLVFVLLFS